MKNRTLLHSCTRVIVFIFVFLVLTYPVWSQNLVVNRHNNFIFQLNTSPGKSTEPLVVISSVLGSNQFIYGSSIISSTLETNVINAATALTFPPLFYPSPFRVEDGSTLGYRLNKSANISIRIYDIRGNEIVRRDIEENEIGGQVGYNYVPFTRESFGNSKPPSGVYFYIVMHESDVLGKGKFAIRP